MATPRTGTAVMPKTHRDLLEKPVIALLATARPDGALRKGAEQGKRLLAAWLGS